jgi:hypothetical protein
LSGPDLTSVTVAGNTIDTGGKRIGLLIDTAGQPNDLAVKVEGNDFRNNAVGVSIWGNTISPGTIDLGGGALGSMGQNDFRGFTAATAAQGRFAIALHMTNAQAVVAAKLNLWSESNLGAVIKDGTDNVAHAEAVVFDPSILPEYQKGTGRIDLGMPVWSPGGSGGGAWRAELGPREPGEVPCRSRSLGAPAGERTVREVTRAGPGAGAGAHSWQPLAGFGAASGGGFFGLWGIGPVSPEQPKRLLGFPIPSEQSGGHLIGGDRSAREVQERARPGVPGRAAGERRAPPAAETLVR